MPAPRTLTASIETYVLSPSSTESVLSVWIWLTPDGDKAQSVPKQVTYLKARPTDGDLSLWDCIDRTATART